jgi:inorganic pyrophosphatase
MDITKIPTGKNPPTDVNVLIENPMGGDPIKYELDKASGAVFVDRFLTYRHVLPGELWFYSPHTLW